MITTRAATAADNSALIALASACPIVGDITMCVDRRPDFFVLNHLEGDHVRVGVAEDGDQRITGCVAIARRRCYIHGKPTTTAYSGDLKVHPDARGGRSAAALLRWAREKSGDFGDPTMPALATVMAGNHSMERLTGGRSGLPTLSRFATVRVHAIPLLLRRRTIKPEMRITSASQSDADTMTALWGRVAPGRQFAPAWNTEDFAAWITAAPGLAWQDYWLAWHPDGRLAGFVAIWEQSLFKQLRVLAYSRRLAAMRAVINAAGSLTGAATLPASGGTLRTATALHVCVPPDHPQILNALLRHISNTLRARGFAFFTIGLDINDPLTTALGGMMAQPTDINAYATSPCGHYAGAPLDDRPLHYDIALV